MSASRSKQWQDHLNEPGSGSLVLQNDDPDLALVTFGDIVRFKVDDVTAFAILVEGMERVAIAPGEEVDEATTISGRGHLAVLEEAVVYPARGVDQLPIEEDRAFNWTGLSYDDSAWGVATSIGAQSGSFAYWTGLPSASWPDHSAEWIWASKQDPSYPALDEWSPAGTCYFRHEFVVPAGVFKVAVYLCADADSDLYFDGGLFLSNQASQGGSGDPTNISTAILDVTPGTHLIAAQCTNDIDPEGDMVQNPGGILIAVYSANQSGGIVSLLAHSDASWLIVEYPAVAPGMTPGEVWRIVIEEAQARGCIPEVTLMFSDSADAEGVPWPEVTDIATKVGTDYLTFLREVTATYVDCWMAPTSFELWLWVKDGRGVATPVDFHTPTSPDDPNSGNLLSLDHKMLG